MLPRSPAITSFAPAAPGRTYTSTSTSSSRAGTSLERAHSLAHGLRDAIEAEFEHSEVLIHTEPEGSYREPDALADDPGRAG